jgi:hypothetical protein
MKRAVRLSDLLGIKKKPRQAKAPSQLQAIAMQWHRALTRKPAKPPPATTPKRQEPKHGR